MSDYYPSDYYDSYGRRIYGYPNSGNRRNHPREPHVPPPKPVAPVGDELLKNYATTHRARPVSAGVKFKTREDLMIGLDYLAGRVTPSAQNETVRALGQDSVGGGLGAMLFLAGQSNKGDWYDNNIRQKVEAISISDEFLSGGGKMFHGSWDYDGPGIWHKASLDVTADRDGFYLHHYAAYVGNQAEVRLIQALSDIATLGLMRYEHRLTYETHGDRWAIPLDDLRIIYASVFREFDPDTFLIELTNPTNPEENKGKWADVTGPVIVNPSAGGVRCIIKLGYRTLYAGDHDRGDDNKPLPHHAYLIEGDNLTGPARKRNDDFAEDWRDAIDLQVYLVPLRFYDTQLADTVADTSSVMEIALQRRQKRPDPYPNE